LELHCDTPYRTIILILTTARTLNFTYWPCQLYDL
jgi:hypothetical protein